VLHTHSCVYIYYCPRIVPTSSHVAFKRRVRWRRWRRRYIYTERVWIIVSVPLARTRHRHNFVLRLTKRLIVYIDTAKWRGTRRRRRQRLGWWRGRLAQRRRQYTRYTACGWGGDPRQGLYGGRGLFIIFFSPSSHAPVYRYYLIPYIIILRATRIFRELRNIYIYIHIYSAKS